MFYGMNINDDTTITEMIKINTNNGAIIYIEKRKLSKFGLFKEHNEFSIPFSSDEFFEILNDRGLSMNIKHVPILKYLQADDTTRLYYGEIEHSKIKYISSKTSPFRYTTLRDADQIAVACDTSKLIKVKTSDGILNLELSKILRFDLFKNQLIDMKSLEEISIPFSSNEIITATDPNSTKTPGHIDILEYLLADKNTRIYYKSQEHNILYGIKLHKIIDLYPKLKNCDTINLNFEKNNSRFIFNKEQFRVVYSNIDINTIYNNNSCSVYDLILYQDLNIDPKRYIYYCYNHICKKGWRNYWELIPIDINSENISLLLKHYDNIYQNIMLYVITQNESCLIDIKSNSADILKAYKIIRDIPKEIYMTAVKYLIRNSSNN